MIRSDGSENPNVAFRTTKLHLLFAECDLMCELEILLAKEKKNELIVDAYLFDDLRINSPNPNKVTQSMATVYLAGAFSRKNCEVNY